MTFWRMPLLVWANLATSALVVLGTPFIAGSQFMMLFDRVMHTEFFDPAKGGNVILYQHIFWFYSHPAVYIMMLPGFGIISEVLSDPQPQTDLRLPADRALDGRHRRARLHRLGAPHVRRRAWRRGCAIPMMATTMLIAIPTGIKIFSWLATIWRGMLHMTTAMCSPAASCSRS